MNTRLDKYDFEKLLDDIKLIARSVQIVIKEDDVAKRKYAGLLTENLLTRLYRDIREMYDEMPQDKGYGGYLMDDGDSIT